jgi:hypothetical protein
MNKTKKCCVCKNHLPLDMFSKNKGRSDGLQTRCKACDKEYQKTTKKEYNIKYASDYQKLESYKLNQKKHKIERYINDINYQISSKIRSRLSEAIRYNFKTGIAVNLLGCSIEQYKKYLESKFTPDMNWNNYKTVWEIDHIIEICTFDLTIEENIHKCFHYTNTQPLYKIENRRRKSPSVLIN